MDINRYRLPGFEKRFSRKPQNRACLVVVETAHREKGFLDDSLKEMTELLRAAGIQAVAVVKGKLPHPSPSHFLREGKLTEVTELAKQSGANVIIFNCDLSPSQAANVEMFAKVPAMDRTGLILEIFGRRAKSNEGKLQVELAQLSYALPRLGGLGVVMSRQGGGVGTRGGAGEQELEHDKRKVRLRIRQVKDELQKVKRHRELLRAGRKRRNFLTVSLVGYTNAGKSTLLNSLTGATSLVEDKLFATLDPVTRQQNIGSGEILFVDTVGFLRDLPHALVEAFHATLEEVTEADGLIHVLDASDPKARDLKVAVEKVLDELKVKGKPVVLALNKADLLNDEARAKVQETWPEGILISAKEKLGLQSLLTRLEGWMTSAHEKRE